MAKFHQLRVSDITNTTEECVIVSLKVPQSISSDFEYKQGQYLTLKAEINGENVQRSYSLCSSPIEKGLQVGIKQVPFGKFSTYANKTLKVGDTIESLAPNGNLSIRLFLL